MTEPLDVPAGWSVVDGRLHRELRFPDFDVAFAFMTRVAAEARRLDHHPDWSNSWNVVVIDIVDHSAGAITARCAELARAIDAVEAG
jgi:4a-hydroxytetrahydrobiopterin dehydratase